MRERTPKRRRKLLAAAGAGMAVAYFFDPQLGRTRRAKARDRVGAMVRRAGRRLGRWGRWARSSGYGRWLRGTDGGRITVNAEDGVVILRGEVASAERMAALASAVLQVPGVVGVENLLHLPGEPAPNKARALEASARAANRPS